MSRGAVALRAGAPELRLSLCGACEKGAPIYCGSKAWFGVKVAAPRGAGIHDGELKTAPLLRAHAAQEEPLTQCKTLWFAAAAHTHDFMSRGGARALHAPRTYLWILIGHQLHISFPYTIVLDKQEKRDNCVYLQGWVRLALHTSFFNLKFTDFSIFKVIVYVFGMLQQSMFLIF